MLAGIWNHAGAVTGTGRVSTPTVASTATDAVYDTFDDDEPTFPGGTFGRLQLQSGPVFPDPRVTADSFVSERPFISPILQMHCRQDRADLELSPAERENLRRKILAELPGDIAVEASERFADEAVILLPGVVNFFPTNRYFNRMSAVFGHGGLVVGVARDHPEQGSRGLFDYVGGDVRVLQPYWPAEVAIVVERLAVAFRTHPRLMQARRYTVEGHSKSVLIAIALSTLSDHYNYARDDGLVPREMRGLFPGLDQVSPDDLRLVMHKLRDARFVGVGGPIEGIDDGFLDNALVQIINRGFLRDTGKHFTPDFIRAYFTALGTGPEAIDLLVTSRVAAEKPQSQARDPVKHGPLGRVAVKAAQALFRGVGQVFHAGSSDGLIPAYAVAYPHHHVLRGPYTHLEQIEHREAATDLIRLLLGLPN